MAPTPRLAAGIAGTCQREKNGTFRSVAVSLFLWMVLFWSFALIG
jgi:hypothetical protein